MLSFIAEFHCGSLVSWAIFSRRESEIAATAWCFAFLQNPTGPSLKIFTIFEGSLCRNLKNLGENLWKADLHSWRSLGLRRHIGKTLNTYPMGDMPKEEEEQELVWVFLILQPSFDPAQFLVESRWSAAHPVWNTGRRNHHGAI